MKLRQMKRRASLKRGFGWGKRCPQYCPGCITCEAWAFYDEHKRFPVFKEAMDICLQNNMKDEK